MTPTSPFASPALHHELKMSAIPELTIGPSALEKANAEGAADGYEMTLHDAGAPLSPFHYQLRKVGLVVECTYSVLVTVYSLPFPVLTTRHGACRTLRRRSTKSSAPTSTAG
jgi:hypothetical protein